MRVFGWMLTAVQVLLMITAYGVQTYSMKKMGVMRHIVFLNHQWETKYPIIALKYAAITILSVITVIIIIYIVFKSYNKKVMSMLLVGVIVTLVFIFFTVFYSPDSYRSYYFMSIALGVTALLQYLKTIMHLKGYSGN
jgi:hypothetical protein